MKSGSSWHRSRNVIFMDWATALAAAAANEASSRADHIIPTAGQMAAFSTVTLVDWNVRQGGKRKLEKVKQLLSKHLKKKNPALVERIVSTFSSWLHMEHSNVQQRHPCWLSGYFLADSETHVVDNLPSCVIRPMT